MNPSSKQNDKYINMRKRKARRLSLLFHIMHLLPMKKNKIVFSAFEGDGGYGCNPKYIAEELHRRHPEYELIWLLHDPTKEFPEYVRPIRDSVLNTVYHLSTAHIWVDNYRKPLGTIKRRNQLYIQTWHATIGFKAVGLYRGDAFPPIARMVSEWDSGLADYFLSNSRYCDEVYPYKLLYDGPTLRVGSPRVDPLINDRDELHNRLRKSLNIAIDTKLLLFAPTFRGGDQKGKKQVVSEIPGIDFAKLMEALEGRFGGRWKILLRLHPQLAAKLKEMPLTEEPGSVENKMSKKCDISGSLIDVSQYPDISEIMCGCDMVITDYSSCAFDASFAGIPVLLYADDVQEYIRNRGQFMWKREELPFDIAETNDELILNIEKFDEKPYLDRVHAFMYKHEVVEDGHAAERVADVIEKHISSGTDH